MFLRWVLLGVKKRNSDGVDIVDNQMSNASSENKVSADHLRKKIKKGNKKEGEIADGFSNPNNTITSDAIEGGHKSEAEKDDGLNNCAPSLRYAVQRLIPGVSSSREVNPRC